MIIAGFFGWIFCPHPVLPGKMTKGSSWNWDRGLRGWANGNDPRYLRFIKVGDDWIQV
jgi:hypothetical protein